MASLPWYMKSKVIKTIESDGKFVVEYSFHPLWVFWFRAKMYFKRKFK